MGDFPQFVQVPGNAATGPCCTREKYADMVGLPVGVIVGWCNRGLVPCVRIGKYSLVNLELLRKRFVDQEFA